MRALLRQQDWAVCFELHGRDFALLREGLKGDRRFRVRQEDGFARLKGLLPPLSRRACVFIDPPYEIKEDYVVLPQVLAESLRRFPTGLYIIWYPLLGRRDAALPGKLPAEHPVELPAAASGVFPETLFNLYTGNRCRVELRMGSETDRGMYGCGLVIYNPPWTLKAALEGSMPFMAELLGKDGESRDLVWEEKSTIPSA
jgi:23S rRNA (adenine2030-N6)-methyltransferase